MRWNLVCCGLVLGTLCAALNLPAADRLAHAQFTDSTINRHGLTRAWTAQVTMDASSAQLKHVKLFVDRKHTYTVHEISYGTRKEYISERDIDAGGSLLGVEGARKKLEQRLLFLKGQNPVVTEKVLPETLLVCVTSRGMVQVIDAETGRTRWSRLVGNPKFDTLAPAVTEDRIGIVSGNNLYLLRTVDGLPLKTVPLKHVAAAGPAIAEGWVYVPRLDGWIDWYPIDEQTTLPSWFRGVGKRLEMQPSVQPGYVSWITEEGYLYSLNAFTQKVQFEIKLMGKPVGPPLYAGDYKIVCATRNGYIVCVDLRTSTILWRYSTGEPIVSQPLVLGDSVYATNTTGLLTKLSLATGVNVETGGVGWTTSGVKEILAAANGRIYALGTLGDLVSIDVAKGAIVDRIPLDTQDALNIFNPTTNRLLLAKKTGLVQSLRPTSQFFPEIFPGALESAKNGEEAFKPKKRSGSSEEKSPAAPDAKPAEGDDPFGGGAAKPGEGEKKEEKKEENPADPFGS